MTFIITIDNPNKRFTAGQLIVGRVCCTLEHSTSVEIKVKLYGEECTYYTEPIKRTSTTCNQSWKYIFFKSEDAVIRSGYLDTAEHKFPFTLTLPLRLPSNYSGRYGHVKYFLKAEATSYSGTTECEDEIELKVFSPTNLRDLKNVSLMPATYSRDLTMTKWFCIPEVLDMEVKLEKNGFILGEIINVDVKLFNNTYMAVSTVWVELHNQVEAKVSSPNWKFLTVRQLLTADRRAGFRSHRTNNYLFHLRVPDDAEIPNFKNCTLLKQKGILEVIAVLEDSTKRKLAIEIELVLGHYSSVRQEEFLKDGQRAYGMVHPSPPEISKSGSPSELTRIPVLYPPSQNSSRSSTEQLHIGPNAIPPYPIDFKSELFFNNQELIVPVPEGKTFFSYPEKEMNLPYPPSNPVPYSTEDKFSSTPYSTVGPFPNPRQNRKRQPYPTVGDPPYPREESKNLLPYPKEDHFSSAPYPIGSSPPYSKENSRNSHQPYSPVADPPYPKEESKGLPYPKDDNISSAPYSTGSSPPYPKESSTKNHQPYLPVADPPYPGEKSKDLPYPKENNFSSGPYPPQNSCPYPIENSKKDQPSIESKDRSLVNVTHSSVDSCPYPSDAKPGASPPYLQKLGVNQEYNKVRVKRDNLSSEPNAESCPYPTSTTYEAIPPYPKGDVQKHNKSNVSSSSTRSSFEENTLPYPKEGEEKAPLLQTSFADTSELPTKMPMPGQSFQTDILPYPSKMQMPCPPAHSSFSTSKTAEFSPPASGNAVPYPLEQPPIHSTLGFAEFIPMPMPSDKSSITCGSIGFAVPTSMPLHSTKSLEIDEQPSAPLLSDLKTPPIAMLEELEDLLFIDTDDEAAETEDSELKCSRQSGGESSSQLDTEPPPSYDEARQSLKKKKKDRPKRELLLAT